MGLSTFSGPVRSLNGFEGSVTGDVTGTITLPAFTVATAPAATGLTGTIIYVSNGRAGLPTVAVSDGTNWISSAGITIATS
jgi:hypothetical protein